MTRAQLFGAIRRNCLDDVMKFCETTPDINELDKNGETSLLFAADKASPEIVDFLTDHGADLDIQNKEGRTALHKAAWLGRASVIRVLSKRGAALSLGDRDEATPLHLAALSHHSEAVTALIEAGAELNSRNKDGETPLHRAVQFGYVDAVTALVDGGADVNALDAKGWTPLHKAAWFNQADIAAYLIQHGSDTTLLTQQGISARDLAKDKGAIGVLTVIQQGSSGSTASPRKSISAGDTAVRGHISPSVYKTSDQRFDCTFDQFATFIRDGDLASVRQCHSSPHINRFSKESWTPLQLATSLGHTSIVTYLLEQGADVNAIREDGWTALHIAARQGNATIASHLISAGAMPLITGHSQTPLQLAQLGEDDALITVLDNHQTRFTTQLFTLAGTRSLKEFSRMMALGADPNAQSSGDYLLHAAVRANAPEIVEVLLQYGADTEVKDLSGRTPKDLALSLGYRAIVPVLDYEYRTQCGRHETASGPASPAKSPFVRKAPPPSSKPQPKPSPVEEDAKSEAQVQVSPQSEEPQDQPMPAPEHASEPEPTQDTLQTGESDISPVEKQPAEEYCEQEIPPITLPGRECSTPLPVPSVPPSVRLIRDSATETDHNKVAAVKEEDLGYLEELCDEDPDVQIADDDGRSLLYLALKNYDPQTAMWLRGKGAAVQQVPADSVTALCIAVFNGNLHSIRNLTPQDSSTFDKDGWSLLHWAAAGGDEEVVKALLASSLSPDAGSATQATPMHVAAMMGHAAVVQQLARSGGNVNAADAEGRTPLHFAALGGHIQVLQTLTWHHAVINARDHRGQSALYKASENGDEEVSNWLREHGAL